jgi:hypothetical protein
MGVWKDDHIRNVGALAKANVNMTFYRDGRSDGLLFNDGIKFNIDGEFILQEVQFRLQESNWWVGTNYLFVTAENTLDLSETLPPELPDPSFQFDIAGLACALGTQKRILPSPEPGFPHQSDFPVIRKASASAVSATPMRNNMMGINLSTRPINTLLIL